jgi:hypothetical protein
MWFTLVVSRDDPLCRLFDFEIGCLRSQGWSGSLPLKWSTYGIKNWNTRSVRARPAARYKQSADAFKRAVELKPDYATAHVSLGVIYSYLRDKRSAAEEVRPLRSMDLQMADHLFDEIHRDKLIIVSPKNP